MELRWHDDMAVIEATDTRSTVAALATWWCVFATRAANGASEVDEVIVELWPGTGRAIARVGRRYAPDADGFRLAVQLLSVVDAIHANDRGAASAAEEAKVVRRWVAMLRRARRAPSVVDACRELTEAGPIEWFYTLADDPVVRIDEHRL